MGKNPKKALNFTDVGIYGTALVHAVQHKTRSAHKKENFYLCVRQIREKFGAICVAVMKQS